MYHQKFFKCGEIAVFHGGEYKV